MLPQELTIQCLTPGLLPFVVALHTQALPYSLNCRLGLRHLARLYAAMQGDPECHVTVAMLEGDVAGVVSVALNPGKFVQNFMAQLTLGQWAALAGRLVVRPTLLLAWRESRDLGRPLWFKGQVVQPCLSAIAVAAKSRRSGIGKALVERVDDWIRASHYPAYYLDTLADNQAARTFYQRLGFTEVEQRGKSIMLAKGV